MPDLCLPLQDPFCLLRRPDGFLFVGHQIARIDGEPVHFHQEWWVAGEVSEEVLGVVATWLRATD